MRFGLAGSSGIDGEDLTRNLSAVPPAIAASLTSASICRLSSSSYFGRALARSRVTSGYSRSTCGAARHAAFEVASSSCAARAPRACSARDLRVRRVELRLQLHGHRRVRRQRCDRRIRPTAMRASSDSMLRWMRFTSG